MKAREYYNSSSVRPADDSSTSNIISMTSEYILDGGTSK